jgi:hypothetical protein
MGDTAKSANGGPESVNAAGSPVNEDPQKLLEKLRKDD